MAALSRGIFERRVRYAPGVEDREGLRPGEVYFSHHHLSVILLPLHPLIPTFLTCFGLAPLQVHLNVFRSCTRRSTSTRRVGKAMGSPRSCIAIVSQCVRTRGAAFIFLPTGDVASYSFSRTLTGGGRRRWSPLVGRGSA
ncbi:hypothetical protein QJS04_geneDACA017245 [Acorus gramineus]|uniref:Uncharacterized protein n=1 Tax=Acorus gramineus TaxID=55184 RepID=A0AAV8ZVS9_ACOGR|nr:hypothetical protein QJS04_geneDACA017245 [Acorus gramineus]